MKRELFCYNQYIPEEEKIKLRLDREKDIFLHSHEFVELVYVIEGEADHIVDDKVYRICEGDFFLLDSGVTHAFDGGGRVFTSATAFSTRSFSTNCLPTAASLSNFHITCFSTVPSAVQKSSVTFNSRGTAAAFSKISFWIWNRNTGRSAPNIFVY